MEEMTVRNIVEGGVSDVTEGFEEGTDLLVGAGVLNEGRDGEEAVERRVVAAGGPWLPSSCRMWDSSDPG